MLSPNGTYTNTINTLLILLADEVFLPYEVKLYYMRYVLYFIL